MKIGIIDAEIMCKNKHRFPNLVCMKLSAYYKNQGNEINLKMMIEEVGKGIVLLGDIIKSTHKKF